MEFYEGSYWTAVVWSFLAMLVVFCVAGWARTLAVPGTRARYWWATVERGSMYPALTGVLLNAVEATARRDLVGLGIHGSLAGLMTWNISRRRRDDDDDWFTDLRARLRSGPHYASGT